MKNRVPTIPTKSNSNEGPLFLCGKQLPPYWVTVDWLQLINIRKPELIMTFKKDSNFDWVIYDQIDILSENLGIDFIDAAHWALQRALGERFEDARRMALSGDAWDSDLLYLCRIVSLQLCQNFGRNVKHTLAEVDNMIDCLLLTEHRRRELGQASLSITDHEKLRGKQ